MRRSKLSRDQRRQLRWECNREACIRMDMVPVAYDAGLQKYAPTLEPRFYMVMCPHCGNTYHPKSGEYIRRHMERKHGMAFKETLDRWYGLRKGDHDGQA